MEYCTILDYTTGSVYIVKSEGRTIEDLKLSLEIERHTIGYMFSNNFNLIINM